MSNRYPRNRYYRETARRRIEHPIRDLIGSSLRLSDQEMVDTVVLVVTNYQYSLAEHWMKRIGNHGFECQKPGTMAPARIAAESIGRLSRR